jgi:hypothetical protein
VDVDDVSIEQVDVPDVPKGAPDLTYENGLLQMTLSANGMLKQFRCKSTGKDYSISSIRIPAFTAVRDGVAIPVLSVARDGEMLNVRFLDPDVKASLRIRARKRHFLIEVTDIQPEDVDELTIEFPVKQLKTVAFAFNATYDDEFGACMFGTTVNARNLPAARRNGMSLRGSCYRAHGIVGAKFALLAAPWSEFKSAIMEAERENGLPCPMLDQSWARDSDDARRSYLFGVRVTESDIDKLIEYAKIGGFGTILILKNSWLSNHGHFDVNTKNFPGGRESLKLAVKKIHDAGLKAGAHVFGPSVSPNDPYITPKPDDRLAFVPCPPLAENIDAKATALTLTGQPDLPPRTTRTRAYPGYYLRVGDEIIRYREAEVGPPFRFLKCQRGALGTKAAPHKAGDEVKGLLTVWGFFLVDPDSTLADELTGNFADVFNECDFDMVYFDASDGIQDGAVDRWYYLNKMHLGFYKKFKKDVLYQTSNGTGTNMLWHIVPRSASADGHGDIKGYLDQRWPGILNQAKNFTRSDIGWYYWFRAVRPDQIEYVCAKAMGIDGSISLETSVAASNKLIQSRQMFKMIARYEKCRLSNYFPESVKDKLRKTKKDFKLSEDGQGGWRLYRAVYEEPRTVDALDGTQNVWTITNDRPGPSLLGVEIVRGHRHVAKLDYSDPKSLTIEDFSDPAEYRMSERNPYEKFVIGGGKMLSENGPVRKGVTQTFEVSREAPRVGEQSLVYSAENKGGLGGWCGIGRRFEKPLDLTAYRAAGLWIHGDGKGEIIRIQFRDAAGRHADFLPKINFKGWRLLTFPFPDKADYDWSKTDYLLFYFNGIPAATAVRVRFGQLRMLHELRPPVPGKPALIVNGKRTVFPTNLERGQALTSEGPGGVKLWPGGMKPGRNLDLTGSMLRLNTGNNKINFSWNAAKDFPGDVKVLLYQMWPIEE